MNHNGPWYTFKNDSGQTMERFIFDGIDNWYGVSAKNVADQIRNLDSPG